MLKNLTSGAIINYGATLPDPSTAFDGALFYKNAGTNQGLYVFGFIQDSNSATTGEQVAQGWIAASSSDVYVQKTGDTMSGDLTISSSGTYRGLRLVGTGGSTGSLGANTGSNNGVTLSADSGPIIFIAGGSQRMNLSSAGVLTVTTAGGTGTVWHSVNDGSGSGLDADLLDGQDSTYYTNATNMTSGTLPVARLPFIPVQQGGGPGQNVNKLNIGWNGSNTLLLSIDGVNQTNWPINISGTAGYASSAGTANTANSATNAVSAQYLRQSGGAGAANMTFNWSGQGGQPSWLWGGNDGFSHYVYNPINFTVYSAGRIRINADLGNVPMAMNYQGQGQLEYFWMTSEPNNTWVVHYSAITSLPNATVYRASNLDNHLPGIRNDFVNNASCAQLIQLANRMKACGVVWPGGGVGVQTIGPG